MLIRSIPSPPDAAPARRSARQNSITPPPGFFGEIHSHAAAFCPKLIPVSGVLPESRGAADCEVPMNVETILRAKGREVATIRPDQTVGDAVNELISRNIGALVVSENGDSVDGIISERDIVHAVANRDANFLSL